MNISKVLREIIKKERRSIGKLAKAIGVDRSSFYRALKDEGNPERRTIELVLDYLGYDIRFVKSKRKEVKADNKGRLRQGGNPKRR